MEPVKPCYTDDIAKRYLAMLIGLLIVLVVVGTLIGMHVIDYCRNYQGVVLTVLGVVFCALLF